MTIPGRFQSTKTITYSAGLSACFRQHRAHSHCRFLHGYAIQVRATFEADELDVCNWVVDFGSLKSFKGWLEDTFDHKTLVAQDDPQLNLFREMETAGVIQMVEVPSTGCESYASMIGECLIIWLAANGYSPRARLVSVEVSEHEGNSAIWFPGSSDAV